MIIEIEATSKTPNSPISAFGLNRNPRNIYIYSSGYDFAPALTSDYFSIFEIASSNYSEVLEGISVPGF